MSSLTSSSSGWKSAIKKFRNKVDNIVHNFPKLPDFLGEEHLPFLIGEKVSLKEYNTFLDRNESTGYKFYWVDKNVYIIDMANADREAAVSYLQECFGVPNNRVMRGPIKVLGQPFHYNPTNPGEKIAPDVAVYGDNLILPTTPHPGPPPSNTSGWPHARIICEVANAQSVDLWDTRCEAWMHEVYVCCVLGIKLFPAKTVGTASHRPMIAKLWTRGAWTGAGAGAVIPTSVLSTNATLAGAGVYVTKWDFGTGQENNVRNPTNCTAANLVGFQITIPISDVFWDPPLNPAPGAPPYAGATVPNTVVGQNFIIDLYDVQQVVLNP